MVHFYCCSLNTDGKNNEREKYAKHSQKKKVTGSWINVLNKLSPSTHSRKLPQFSLLIYYKEHPHMSPLWYKIQGNLVPSATLDIFGVFFYKTHVYNLYLPTPLKSSSSSKSFYWRISWGRHSSKWNFPLN